MIDSSKLLALHGFLGLPVDWERIPGLSCEAVDLWADLPRVQGDAFVNWAELFNTRVRQAGKQRVLLGYSMGGRLAMQAAVAAPDLYSACIFVSANPGNAGDRDARLRADEVWARRFREENWETLVASWTGQPVLRRASQASPDALELLRREGQFDREALALALEQWSLARQPDLRASLANLPMPVLFVSGSEDEKFTGILQSLILGPRQRLQVIGGSGHRVPWDRPAAFVQVVREFLAGVPGFVLNA